MSDVLPDNIVVQVGQCGNQIGWRFWDSLLRECRAQDATGVYNDVWAAYFRNSSLPSTKAKASSGFSRESNNIVVDNYEFSAPRGSRLKHLQARAVLIDMEESVVHKILRSELGSLFDSSQLLTDVSGSGNNWAIGYHEYGAKYAESITELLRKEAEACDHLGSFTILNSLGGGTGSGVGSRVLELLNDNYPKVIRIVSCVMPSTVDDVITSPYNSLLAMQTLTDKADFVLPVQNVALTRMAQFIDKHNKQLGHLPGKLSQSRPFGLMNGIVANLLVNLTASSRFSSSSINTGKQAAPCLPLSQLLSNCCMPPSRPVSGSQLLGSGDSAALVAPKMPFLITSIAPLPGQRDSAYTEISPKLDQLMVQALSRPNQLLDVEFDMRRAATFSCVFSLRSEVWNGEDLLRCSSKVKRILRFCSKSSLTSPVDRLHAAASIVTASPANSSCCSSTSSDDGSYADSTRSIMPKTLCYDADSQCHWNLCRQPSLNKISSVTFVALTSAFSSVPARLSDAFCQLYRRRAYVHHYAEHGVELDDFESALQCAKELIKNYAALESVSNAETTSLHADLIGNDRRILSSPKSATKKTLCLSKTVITRPLVTDRQASSRGSTPLLKRRQGTTASSTALLTSTVHSRRPVAVKSLSLTNVAILKRL